MEVVERNITKVEKAGSVYVIHPYTCLKMESIRKARIELQSRFATLYSLRLVPVNSVFTIEEPCTLSNLLLITTILMSGVDAVYTTKADNTQYSDVYMNEKILAMKLGLLII